MSNADDYALVLEHLVVRGGGEALAALGYLGGPLQGDAPPVTS